MTRVLHAVLLLTFVLCACSPSTLSPDALSPTEIVPAPTGGQAPTAELFPSPEVAATVSTPSIEQGAEAPSRPQDCGYQWTRQDLPELSSDFQASIQSLQPEAQASLFAFGENCVRSDGSTSFIPMETDFNVTLQVSDLSDESDLGAWVEKVMQVIESIPIEEIVGPRPGRVSILFQANAEKSDVTFYINQYHDLPAGLSNAEIYQALEELQ